MELGVAAAPGSSSSGLGVGPVGGALDAGPGSAGLVGIQEEPGVRRDGSGSEADPDAPPKKRVRQQEGEAGKLEERLYSVLCCTVCLDLPKASVYQVNNVIMKSNVCGCTFKLCRALSHQFGLNVAWKVISHPYKMSFMLGRHIFTCVQYNIWGVFPVHAFVCLSVFFTISVTHTAD